jgi:sugar transferase (PEP-CTERM/EpsH1 system associated)
LKILFITARFPYPPIKGDKIIPYQRLKFFSKKHEITLLSLADTKADLKHLSAIQQYCKHIYVVPLRKMESFTNMLAKGLSRVPLQVLYFKSRRFKKNLEELLSKNKYDVVHTFMLRMAPYVSSYKGCPKIIELIDSMQLNMRRRASLGKNLKKWIFNEESRRLAAYEKNIVKKFDYGIVVSEVDKKQIGTDNIIVSHLGVDDKTFYPISNGQKDQDLIIFTGNMGYFPNQQAVLYFVNTIFPLIQKKHPMAKFWVVGCKPPKKIKLLEKANKSIRLFGFVDSMTDYINKASIAVCPMTVGSGMQFKILEALACGVPVVATSLAKGDIKLNENDGLFVADNVTLFADRVLEIMENKNLQKVIAIVAPQAIKDKYSWEDSNLIVENIYSSLVNGREGYKCVKP